MKKYFGIIIILTFVFLMVGCDRIVRYTEEELKIITKHVKEYLGETEIPVYFLLKESLANNCDLIQSEFIRVDRKNAT